MSGKATVVCVCATLCVIILIAEMVTAAPTYADYENSIRDLYELMLQKEALEERLGHQIVRKSSRSPSLRLRFGRRSDPNILSGPQFLLPQSGEPERLEN
uniref:Short neuropeptide F n=1 Tax=Carabus violaceus TaxID=41075 RepID=A0A7U3RBN4_CARVO|nr:short neuropeptide F [Carabus violaceus]